MLRAAGRRVRHGIVPQNTCIGIRLASERLPFPLICPSHQQFLRQTRRSSTNAGTTIPPSEASQKPSGRSYSTAAAAVEMPDIDPAAMFPPMRSNELPLQKDSELHLLDPSEIIAFENPVQEDRKRAPPKISTGVPTEKSLVLATFCACITTQMVARAQLMLEQISSQLESDSPLLINAHNTFLHALLSRVKAARDWDSSRETPDLKVFFMWYENKMKSQYNIPGDSTTFALLLKASLMIQSEGGRKTYLKAYVRQWKETRDIGDVLGNTLLTDDDVLEIAKICRLKVNELHEKYQAMIAEKKKNLPDPEILSVPEVKATSVKGAGLEAVRSSLRSLIDVAHMPLREYETTVENTELQIERQKLLEEHAFESAQERWKRDSEEKCERGIFNVSQPVSALLWEWHQAFVPLIKEELLRVDGAESSTAKIPGDTDRCLYGPFMRLIEPEKIAAIVIVELLKTHVSAGTGDGPKTSQAVLSIGRQLEMEYLAQEIQKKKNSGVFGHLKSSDLAELFHNRAAFAAMIARARANSDTAPEPTLGMIPEWPLPIRAKLGAILISMLLHCAKISVTVKPPGMEETISESAPAFRHTYEYLKGRKLGVIRLHSELIKRLGIDQLGDGMLGKYLPMVVRPRPWTDWDDGGYYYTHSRVIRIKESPEQKQYMKAAARKKHLDQVFAGLDVLGQTAWKVNRRVFNVVLEVWNSQEEFGKIPAADKEIEFPPEPALSTDPKVRYEWLAEMKRLTTMRRNNHSMRCDVNFKVEIARAFLFEKFYFPHNVDFRGRAYPIPPNLNHIGNDLSRSLLMFAEGKALGDSGLKWLKIHLANLVGYDKASFADRVKFVEDSMGDIKDSAENPLQGNKWWLKAEDPWQCLATCFALHEALSMGDPSKYICHIPVAQDGTCNGLQHYAALGGDKIGAKQVNLEPSDKPQDVYTGVAELVKTAVQEDLEAGDFRAKTLEGLITRKVVKQTVMTNVYGVTFIGAKAQIINQLKEFPSLNRQEIPALALYLTRKVFASIRSMFSGANLIQDWLVTCAKRISRSVGPDQLRHIEDLDTGKGGKKSVHFMTSVIWTTPLRMPVVQPYRQFTSHPISTNLQNVYISDPSVVGKVDSRKQAAAFPPNFIHSLDASHMLLSALACADANLTFASVHDSFWTHPSDVDEMNSILREAFVKLHSNDIMAGLKMEFEERYKGFRTLATIPADSECAREIKEVRKGYSKIGLSTLQDLQWELKRWTLLRSADPLERALGEQMVTPSVILERHGLLKNEPVPGHAETVEGASGEDEKEGDDVSDVPEDPGDVEPTSMEGGAEILDAFDDGDQYEGIEEVEEPTKNNPRTGDGGTAGSSKKVERDKVVTVWVELEFPPLPPRGEFEVKQLKDSEYFFS